MKYAWCSKRLLHLMWFNLRNAIGSILLWFCLRSIGEVVSILMDIYEGSSFQVQTSGGLTDEIPQDQGVKQVLSALCCSTWL